jgi:hypothetical protein
LVPASEWSSLPLRSRRRRKIVTENGIVTASASASASGNENEKERKREIGTEIKNGIEAVIEIETRVGIAADNEQINFIAVNTHRIMICKYRR